MVSVVRDVGLAPFAIAVDERAGLAFVTCFQDDTVAVLRLNASTSTATLVALLGLSRDALSGDIAAPALRFPALKFPP